MFVLTHLVGITRSAFSFLTWSEVLRSRTSQASLLSHAFHSFSSEPPSLVNSLACSGVNSWRLISFLPFFFVPLLLPFSLPAARAWYFSVKSFRLTPNKNCLKVGFLLLEVLVLGDVGEVARGLGGTVS